MAGIDGSMAHLSDSLFTTAIAIYAVAMVGFTAEYAFGRRGRVGQPAVGRVPARELVGAGGPSRADTKPPTSGRPGDAPSSARAHAGRPASVAASVGAHRPRRAGARHLDRDPGARRRRGAVVNMYEFASAAGLVGVVAFLARAVEACRRSATSAGSSCSPVILMMFLAGTVLYSKAQPLVPALQSYWLAIHVTLAADRPKAR